MKILATLLFGAAIPGEEPIFASEALPWMQPEAAQDDTLKKCLTGRTCCVGGVALLAANLWSGLHHVELYASFIRTRHTYVLYPIQQKLQTTLSCRLQLLFSISYCG
jgi:hypothetical protein